MSPSNIDGTGPDSVENRRTYVEIGGMLLGPFDTDEESNRAVEMHTAASVTEGRCPYTRLPLAPDGPGKGRCAPACACAGRWSVLADGYRWDRADWPFRQVFP